MDGSITYGMYFDSWMVKVGKILLLRDHMSFEVIISTICKSGYLPHPNGKRYQSHQLSWNNEEVHLLESQQILLFLFCETKRLCKNCSSSKEPFFKMLSPSVPGSQSIQSLFVQILFVRNIAFLEWFHYEMLFHIVLPPERDFLCEWFEQYLQSLQIYLVLSLDEGRQEDESSVTPWCVGEHEINLWISVHFCSTVWTRICPAVI